MRYSSVFYSSDSERKKKKVTWLFNNVNSCTACRQTFKALNILTVHFIYVRKILRYKINKKVLMIWWNLQLKIHAKGWISIVGFAELMFLKKCSAYMNLDYTINCKVNRGSWKNTTLREVAEILPFKTHLILHMSYYLVKCNG